MCYMYITGTTDLCGTVATELGQLAVDEQLLIVQMFPDKWKLLQFSAWHTAHAVKQLSYEELVCVDCTGTKKTKVCSKVWLPPGSQQISPA